MPTDFVTYYALITVAVFFMAAVAIVGYLWSSLALTAVYSKLGHHHAWAAWVPFYRSYVFFEVGGRSGWLMFLPVAAGLLVSFASTEVGIRWFMTLLLALILTGFAAVSGVFAISSINMQLRRNGWWNIAFGVCALPVWLSVLAWSKRTAASVQPNARAIG